MMNQKHDFDLTLYGIWGGGGGREIHPIESTNFLFIGADGVGARNPSP